MVLVKVGEVVVEENGRAHFLGQRELEMAPVCLVDSDAVVEGDGDVGLARPHCIHGSIRALEGSLDIVAGYGTIAAAIPGQLGSIFCAVGVVESKFLDLTRLSDASSCSGSVGAHLGAGIEQQSSDRSEYDSNGEEQGQDGLGCEDGPVAISIENEEEQGTMTTYCQAFKRCCRNAVSIANQSAWICRGARWTRLEGCSLAGRRLFFLSGCFGPSLESMESVWSMPRGSSAIVGKFGDEICAGAR